MQFQRIRASFQFLQLYFVADFWAEGRKGRMYSARFQPIRNFVNKYNRFSSVMYSSRTSILGLLPQISIWHSSRYISIAFLFRKACKSMRIGLGLLPTPKLPITHCSINRSDLTLLSLSPSLPQTLSCRSQTSQLFSCTLAGTSPEITIKSLAKSSLSISLSLSLSLACRCETQPLPWQTSLYFYSLYSRRKMESNWNRLGAERFTRILEISRDQKRISSGFIGGLFLFNQVRILIRDLGCYLSLRLALLLSFCMLICLSTPGTITPSHQSIHPYSSAIQFPPQPPATTPIRYRSSPSKTSSPSLTNQPPQVALAQPLSMSKQSRRMSQQKWELSWLYRCCTHGRQESNSDSLGQLPDFRYTWSWAFGN